MNIVLHKLSPPLSLHRKQAQSPSLILKKSFVTSSMPQAPYQPNSPIRTLPPPSRIPIPSSITSTPSALSQSACRTSEAGPEFRNEMTPLEERTLCQGTNSGLGSGGGSTGTSSEPSGGASWGSVGEARFAGRRERACPTNLEWFGDPSRAQICP